MMTNTLGVRQSVQTTLQPMLKIDLYQYLHRTGQNMLKPIHRITQTDKATQTITNLKPHFSILSAQAYPTHLWNLIISNIGCHLLWHFFHVLLFYFEHYILVHSSSKFKYEISFGEVVCSAAW